MRPISLPSLIRIAALGILGLGFNLWATWTLFLPGATTGRNDFLSFYAGATLAGTADLYDPAKISEVQLRATGETGDSQKFIRLPCYAIFLRPLAWFPYLTAYILWELLSATALIVALVLWPGPTPRTKWLIACWMLPVFVGFLNGQDDTLVWFWIALSARLLHRRWPLAAGLALSFAASKYHLLAMIPIVILAQRRWRLGAGVVLGGGILLAISFVVAGSAWPWRYLALLRDPRLAPDMSHAPSLYASFRDMRFGPQFEITAVIVLAAVVFRISRLDATFERPAAFALAGSILVSLHSWLADCTLLLPALMLAGQAEESSTRFPSFALVTPVPWFLLQLPAPLPMLSRALILWLVLGGLARSERVAGQRHSPSHP
jgi:Glycosyltransferase family 87